jgi:hypothetical protein
MPQAPGAPDAPTMLLRLSVPAGDGFQVVAVDLAVKVAEYVGCAPPDVSKVVALLESLAATVAPGAHDASGPSGPEVTFEFHQHYDELRIEASCEGRTSEARHPLPAAT